MSTKPRAHVTVAERRDPTTWASNPEIYYTQWIEAIRAAVSQSVAGVVLEGARAIPLASRRALTSGSAALVGFTLRNLDPANEAIIQLWDADDQAAGTLVGTVSLAPGESRADFYGPGGVSYTTGLWALVSGPSSGVEGSIWVRG